MDEVTQQQENASAKRYPILVTGVPRSGTTWLARVLANSHGTALAGREPMNPRGSQYGLGGTLRGWARLNELEPRQRRLLRTAYRGLNPFVYSRYGRHQWAAGLPWTRLIIKDPFAMLSLPAIVRATQARPILIYRHPGAVLASYRRMGWTDDLGEIGRILTAPGEPDQNRWAGSEDVWNMGMFWASLNRQALADTARIPGALVVSHEDIASSGPDALRQLFDVLGLRWNPTIERLQHDNPRKKYKSTNGNVLHNFRRPSQEVASAWRAYVSESDIEVLESVAGDTMRQLDARRITFA